MRAGKKNKKKAKGKKEDKEARTTEVISETSGGCHAFLSLATRKNPPRACVERRDVRTRGGGPSWNGGSGRIRTGGRRSGGLRKKNWKRNSTEQLIELVESLLRGPSLCSCVFLFIHLFIFFVVKRKEKSMFSPFRSVQLTKNCHLYSYHGSILSLLTRCGYGFLRLTGPVLWIEGPRPI